MKTVAIAAVLFVTLVSSGAGAQPRVGAEVPSAPLRSRTEAAVAAPAVAMARDANGVAIAWTMRNAEGAEAIFVTRLDLAGRAVGVVRELPRYSADAHAGYPSLAASPDGRGFTLAWLELPTPFAISRAVYCTLDGDLNASLPQLLAIMRREPLPPPPVVRSGTSTWITANAQLWEIRRDGTAASPLSVGIEATDMSARGERPQLVANHREPTDRFTCAIRPGCSSGAGGPFGSVCFSQCRIYQHATSLRFLSLYSSAESVALRTDATAAPAVQSDGRDSLVVWFDGDERFGGTVLAARVGGAQPFAAAALRPLTIGTYGPDTPETRPDVATDGIRYVAVWRVRTSLGNHDISGAAVERDGGVTRFSIAATGSDERDPAVIALGPGNFLVAYETFASGERRIAARLVTFSSRRRAAS